MKPPGLKPRVIFFDAVGTLIHLPKGVGYHYALVGERLGLTLQPTQCGEAFAAVWKEMPARPATGAPRADDDKGWWHELVERVLDRIAPQTTELDRDNYFEAVYAHFAEAGVWELYPEVLEVLDHLQPRHQLAVISNFDGRLRIILERLGVSRYFANIIVSSEVGADKPDPIIFHRALELTHATPPEALHAGDDPVHDWAGASAAGIPVFRLERPRNSLRHLLSACAAT